MPTTPQLRAPLLSDSQAGSEVRGFTVDGLPAGAPRPLSPEETKALQEMSAEDAMGRNTVDLDARLHAMAQSGARSSFNPMKVGSSKMESWVSPRSGPDGTPLHRQLSLAERGHERGLAEEDATGNIFVGPGALVVGRGACFGGFSELPWFPTCTSPDEEPTEDEPHVPSWREKIYTVASGRWRYRSDWYRCCS